MKNTSYLGFLMIASACLLTGCASFMDHELWDMGKHDLINQSVDEISFKDSFSYHVLRGHDCRRTPEECRKVCKMALKEGKFFTEKDWDSFKNMKPYKLEKSTGNDEIDAILHAFEEVSDQVIREIVIPYRELDKDGDLTAYLTLNAEVEKMMVKNPGMERAMAVEQVKKDYMSDPELKLVYERVQKAMPVIESLNMNTQLKNSVSRLLPVVQQYGMEQLKKILTGKKAGEGQKQLSGWELAGIVMDVTTTAGPMIWGLGYLASDKWDQYSDWKESEKVVNSQGEEGARN